MTGPTRKSCTGTVRFFNRESGSGLVRPDDGPDDGSGDLYIQIDGTERAARIGRARRVAFEIHHPHTPAAWIADIRPL